MTVDPENLATTIAAIERVARENGRLLDCENRAAAVDLFHQILTDGVGLDRARLEECFVAIDARLQAQRPDLAGKDLSGLTEAFRDRYGDIWAEWVAQAYVRSAA